MSSNLPSRRRLHTSPTYPKERVDDKRHNQHRRSHERDHAHSGSYEADVEHGFSHLELDATGHKPNEQGGQECPRGPTAASVGQSAVKERYDERRSVLKDHTYDRS